MGHLADDNVVDLLSKAIINDTDWQVRRNAAKSLAIHANAKALPSVAIALKDEHWQVRKFALQVFHKIPDIKYLPNVIEALADEYSDVRKEAAIVLGNFNSSDALNALHQALDDPDREVYIYVDRAIKKIQAPH